MNTKRALIVDDEPDIRELLEITLGRMDVETRAAPDLATARSLLAAEPFDLCLTDMHLPDGNGLELVRLISQDHPSLPVAVITAFGSMDTAISALKAGAFDYVQKPVELDALRALVDSALKLGGLAEAASVGTTRLLGESQVMQDLRAQIAKLARSQAPIYISGESGSGKEVAARLIHESGPRAEHPFIPVNCGAIPSELMESEFFGHEKGSFTGAVSDKEGLFQAASGGTLFLDEVADLPLSMQVKLLRAIQEKAVRPVGAQAEQTIDVRILSATHKDLAGEVAEDRFRQDLYYRLNVIALHMPSLREHGDDVPELASHILNKLARDYKGSVPTLSREAINALASYDFPGNVRELENILERAYALCENQRVEPEDLQIGGIASNTVLRSAEPREVIDRQSDSPDVSETLGLGNHPITEPITEPTSEPTSPGFSLPPGESLESYLEKIERVIITDALEETRWNKTAAAKQLGITFRALRYRLKKLELE